MKKKNLKNFIGQLFMLKLETEFIDLVQDDLVSIGVGTCLMLLDIVPVSTLKLQPGNNGYCVWGILKKTGEKKLKHLASFLHGQQIVYYELEYQTTIKNFYYYFKPAVSSVPVKSTVKQKRKRKCWPPPRAASFMKRKSLTLAKKYKKSPAKKK